MYTVFGVQVVERSVCQRDGRWFLKLLQAETDRMEGWCRQMELDQQENDLPEDSRSLFVSVSDHFVFSNCVIQQESESWTQLSVSVIHKRLTGKLFSSLFFFFFASTGKDEKCRGKCSASDVPEVPAVQGTV